MKTLYQASPQEDKTKIKFLESALAKDGEHTTNDILSWLHEKNNEVQTNVTVIPLTSLKEWNMNDNDIHHKSGRFFSIEGIRINTNYGIIPSWDQPIINQPEIGFLGFITQKRHGVLHFGGQQGTSDCDHRSRRASRPGYAGALHFRRIACVRHHLKDCSLLGARRLR